MLGSVHARERAGVVTPFRKLSGKAEACAGPEPPTPGSVCAWGHAPCCGAPAPCDRPATAEWGGTAAGAAGCPGGGAPGGPAPAGRAAQRLGPAGPAGAAAGAPAGAPPGEPAQGARSARRRRQPHLPSVLLRLVDDVLVITPSRATAEALALRLLQGAPAPARALHCLRRAWSGCAGGGSFCFLKGRVGPLHPACKPLRMEMGCV
jgi:hypothetical protein